MSITEPRTAPAPPQAPARPSTAVPPGPTSAPVRRRYVFVGIAMGILGGALAIVGTFLPWASTTYPAAVSFTGWEIYQEQRASDANAYFIGRFWSGQPTPLITGIATLAIGIAIVLLTAIALAAPKRVVAVKRRPGRLMLIPRLPAIVTVASYLTVLVSLFVAVTNAVGVNDRRLSNATAEPGFWITLAGLVLGAIGLGTALSWVGKRKHIEAPPRPA